MFFFFFFFDRENDTTEKIPVDELPEEVRQEITSSDFEFLNENIRYIWHKQEQEYFFSIVDVIEILTEQKDKRSATFYWSKLKERLNSEGADQLLTKCQQLKLKSPKDGKMYKTDVATMEQLFRIIQSVPSPKAEPIKQWLAKVGSERLDEISDPQKAIDRAVETYRKKGYSNKWIQQRLRGIEARKELTDEWQRAGAKAGKDFAVLTNVLTKAWSGKSVSEYKDYKDISKKDNLRDNMTNTEIALNMLAEVSATELSKAQNPKGMKQSIYVTSKGGKIAGNARKELEEALGRSVISKSNSTDKKLLDE